MAKCPFCEYDAPNESDLQAHVATRHPEKGYSAEAMAKELAKAQISQQVNLIAAQLTGIVMAHPFATVEKVMEAYKQLRKELEEWV